MVSYVWSRRIMGFLGFILPIVVVVSGFIVSGSVFDSFSDYYAPSSSREAFIIMLLIVAVFLLQYRGYDIIDTITAKLGGVFAILVMVFPNTAGGWQSVIHFVSATGLFLIFAFFCLFLFTKTKDSRPNDLWHTIISFRFGKISANEPGMHFKQKRNRVYVACGVFMLLGMIFTVTYNLCWKDTILALAKPVLILEWLMIWAFGFSWMVKGKTLFRDRRIPAAAVG